MAGDGIYRRLPRAGGHDHQHIISAYRGLDGLPLTGRQLLETKQPAGGGQDDVVGHPQ